MITFESSRGWLATAVAVPLLLTLGACGNKDEAKPAATQAAARVNGSEISVHQINFALSQLQGVDAKQAGQASKDILERLIEQQMLVNKAIEAKLDRDPRTMQAIEEARRQILARAYLEQRTAGAAMSSQDEVTNFYKEQPELFAQRRQFRYLEAAGTADASVIAALKGKLESGAGLEEVIAFLKTKSIEVSAARFDRVAEQLPLGLLPRMNQIKPGQSALIQSGDRFSVVLMIDVKDVPLTEAQAKPIIERYLGNQKRMQLVQNEVKQLRDTAKIEYLGNFQTPAAKPTAPATKAQPAPNGETNFVDKGLSDLK